MAIHLCGTLRADEPSLTLDQKMAGKLYLFPCTEMRPAFPLAAVGTGVFWQIRRADERYILLLSAQAVRVFAGLLEQESRQKYRLAGIVVLCAKRIGSRTSVRDLLAGFFCPPNRRIFTELQHFFWLLWRIYPSKARRILPKNPPRSDGKQGFARFGRRPQKRAQKAVQTPIANPVHKPT